MSTYHKTVFRNEQDCLKAILEIHNNGNTIDLDPMFSTGNFYKDGVECPQQIFDLEPRVDYCPWGDARNLLVNSRSISCMILDPPFMFERKIRKNVTDVAARYTMYQNGFAELEENYRAILKEAYRVLKFGGILIFKCQDFTDKLSTMTHCLVCQWATEVGFYAADLAVLESPIHKVFNGNKKQRHLRKTHVYFYVFKKRRKINKEAPE